MRPCRASSVVMRVSTRSQNFVSESLLVFVRPVFAQDRQIVVGGVEREQADARAVLGLERAGVLAGQPAGAIRTDLGERGLVEPRRVARERLRDLAEQPVVVLWCRGRLREELIADDRIGVVERAPQHVLVEVEGLPRQIVIARDRRDRRTIGPRPLVPQAGQQGLDREAVLREVLLARIGEITGEQDQVRT